MPLQGRRARQRQEPPATDSQGPQHQARARRPAQRQLRRRPGMGVHKSSLSDFKSDLGSIFSNLTIFTCGALAQRRSSSCLFHLLLLPKFQNEFLKALKAKFNMQSYAIWVKSFKS